MSINKYFAHVKIPVQVLNSIKLACCRRPQELPVSPSETLIQLTDTYHQMSLSPGGAFLLNFQTELKFDKISKYLVKLTKLCINKHFAHVKSLQLVLNPINLACCVSQKDTCYSFRNSDSNDRGANNLH